MVYSFLCQSTHPILVTDFIKQHMDGFKFSDYFRKSSDPEAQPRPEVQLQVKKTPLQNDVDKAKKLFEG